MDTIREPEEGKKATPEIGKRREKDREKKCPPEKLAQKVYKKYEDGIKFNSQINLLDTVENNENFFIGKQWEGVRSNGLPTPVFNMIKRIVLFQVASVCSDNIKINGSPLTTVNLREDSGLLVEQYCNVLNAQFESIWERTQSSRKSREFMRDAAVRGDGCLYSYYDPESETICTELLENTRVFFGNPQEREVQAQPYIIIEKRELVRDVKEMAEDNGQDPDLITPDTDENSDRFHNMTSDKVTLLTCFWKDKETGTIHCCITTKDALVREEWDTKQKLYPIAWMSWDHVTNCYHGMADVTGLIPNQVFVNKMFAMTYLSLMTTAYPKVIYDRTRIKRWDSSVGVAIGVNGGDINSVAKNMEGATISPQIGEFIQMTISTTKDLMGATDAAMGSTRPDNTSAIIALQKAANVPMEMVKQDFYQAIEDMANVWVDLMRCYYGKRKVEISMPQDNGRLLPFPDSMARQQVDFDFSYLETCPINIKLDVGGSAYWSEIAQLQTLDNLLMNKQIPVTEYIKRLPSGYINRQTELVQFLEDRERQAQLQEQAQAQQAAAQQAGMSGGEQAITPDFIAMQRPQEVKGGSGYGKLQRDLIKASTAGSGR